MTNLVDIEIKRVHLVDILRSIDKIIRTQGEKFVDINVLTKKESDNEYARFYINRAATIEVSHRILDEGSASVNATDEGEFVFTSKVLKQIIKEAKSDNLRLRFSDNEYSISVSTQGSFSTPVSLDLPLVSHSEFKKPLYPDNLSKVGSINCDELSETLGIMSSVSPVLDIKITNDEIWWYVSDVVDGDGKAMSYTEKGCPITDYEGTFDLKPINKFLKQCRADEIIFLLNDRGVARFKGKSGPLESEITLTPKTKPNI